MKLSKESLTADMVFHTDTREKADEFVGKLKDLGFEWGSGEPLSTQNVYEEYQEKTCYRIDDGHTVAYADLDYYKNDGYEITEYVLDRDVSHDKPHEREAEL